MEFPFKLKNIIKLAMFFPRGNNPKHGNIISGKKKEIIKEKRHWQKKELDKR
jgi:hypothetical protein